MLTKALLLPCSGALICAPSLAVTTAVAVHLDPLVADVEADGGVPGGREAEPGCDVAVHDLAGDGLDDDRLAGILGVDGARQHGDEPEHEGYDAPLAQVEAFDIAEDEHAHCDEQQDDG
jgi:hypothetical protein